MKAPAPRRQGGHPWVVFPAAGLAGFIAQGTFASSVLALLVFLLSLFIAAFLTALGHSVLTEDSPPEPEPESETSPLGRTRAGS